MTGIKIFQSKVICMALFKVTESYLAVVDWQLSTANDFLDYIDKNVHPCSSRMG